MIEQAVLTQDKPLLKEILLECEQKSIRQTVEEVSAGKVSKLLWMLEEYLYLDSANSVRYCEWIQQLVKKHLGVVLSNG